VLFLAFACSKDDDSSTNGSNDFFENHRNKIWVLAYTDTFSNTSTNYYTGFSNGSYNSARFGEDGAYYCDKLFIGTKNNLYDEELDNVFGDGAGVNIIIAIIENKANELKIEIIYTSLDSSIIYTETYLFLVNGDNLISTKNVNGRLEEPITSKIYNGNLNINFDSCYTHYGF